MTAKLNSLIVVRLVALSARLMAFAFSLAVGACLLAGPIAGPAQAASRGAVTNYTGPGISAPEGSRPPAPARPGAGSSKQQGR